MTVIVAEEDKQASNQLAKPIDVDISLPSGEIARACANSTSSTKPIIGRANQLELLDQQYNLVELRAFCITLLSGERGVGKTALVKQLVRRYQQDPIIYTEIVLTQQHNQTDQFIQTIIADIIIQLTSSSDPASQTLLQKLLQMLSSEDVAWLFEHLLPAQTNKNSFDTDVNRNSNHNSNHNSSSHTLTPSSSSNSKQSSYHTAFTPPLGTRFTSNHLPRKIIRRDAFAALLKRVFIESSRIISYSGFKLICYIKNLEVAELCCLDFITEAFRKQSLLSLFLIYQTPTQNHKGLDYFYRELFTYSSKGHITGQFRTIQVLPLSRSHTHELIRQQLSPATFNFSVLNNIVHTYSKGNPAKTLFILELLKELKLLFRSRVSGAWDAHLEKIGRDQVLSNYLDKTDQFIERSYCTKKVLIYAACYREPFSASILKTITPPELWPQIVSTLEMGIKYDLLRPHTSLPNHFIFQNESFIEQILNRENPNSLNIIYMKILTVLMKHYPKKAPFEKSITSFQLAECINALMPIAVRYNATVTYQTIAINACAGFRALSRNDISQAYRYFKMAKEHLGPQLWDQYHSLCYFIHYHWLRCLYLREEYTRCINEVDQYPKLPLCPLEKAKIAIIKIYCFKATANHALAILESQRVLKSLGVRIPKRPSTLHIAYQYLLSTLLIKTNPQLDATSKRVEISKREASTVIHKLCEMMAHSGYFDNTKFTYYCSLRIVELSHRFGPTSHTAIGSQFCGLTRFLFFNDPRHLDTTYHNRDRWTNPSTDHHLLSEMFYWGMHGPWRFPIKQCSDGLYRALRSSTTYGDDETVGHCSSFYFSFAIIHGKDLRILLKQFSQVIPEIAAPKYSSAYYCNLMMAQAAENAVNPHKFDNPKVIRGEWFDDHLYEEVFRNGDFIGKFCYMFITTFCHLMFCEFDETAEQYKLGQRYTKDLFGIFSVIAFRFQGEMGRIGSISEERRTLKKIKRTILYAPQIILSIIFFKRLTLRQPDNFECFYLLLKGFGHNLLGINRKKALREINQGIKSAKRVGYYNYAGMANELKYRLILSARRPENIRPLQQAVELYQRTQNNMKVVDLLEKIRQMTSTVDLRLR